MNVRLIASGSLLYLGVAFSGHWFTQHMQHQLDVIGCEQAAKADRRVDDECQQLAQKPINFLGH